MDYLEEHEIGPRCQELRERAGLTQGEVGDALGLDQSAVCRIEKAERALTARDISVLSELFGTTSAAILKREGAGRKVLLRANEANEENIANALKIFQECINDFVGVRALALRHAPAPAPRAPA